ncbi:ATP-dependent DNA helicase PIF1-like [Diachasmimorpha longicaudata]|uniref:ATP-dependent DNA helicase PIF1-like n=1 Tax=Diachasmimorpha longicaudata TaxID=58733 RepID=UPI0030B8B2A5
MFKNLILEQKYGDLSKIAVLSARNVDVEEINNNNTPPILLVSTCSFIHHKTTERIYTSINSIENCDNGDIADSILPEYLNTLNPPNLPPHELRLRNNCIIMLIRNLRVNEGLFNGTRLQVLELANNLLRCRILTGEKAGDIVFIHRITLFCEDTYPFTFKRRQFPIKLAFAMTINKNVFNHGQLYVAFSRVRSWDSLIIFLGDQRENNVIKNYVYSELYKM